MRMYDWFDLPLTQERKIQFLMSISFTPHTLTIRQVRCKIEFRFSMQLTKDFKVLNDELFERLSKSKFSNLID
jgi:hypothetical protein